jgi:stage V sporulation protein AC
MYIVNDIGNYMKKDVMNLNKNNYPKYVEKHAKKSKTFINTLKAYMVGGLICAIGESLSLLYARMNVSDDNVKILVPVTLIFIAAFLTGIGLFDNISKFAGAGTLVPITGFANAVVSPAIDSKNEGFILGVGANMFKIAGPVIVYGTIASVIYGVIYWITTLF